MERGEQSEADARFAEEIQHLLLKWVGHATATKRRAGAPEQATAEDADADSFNSSFAQDLRRWFVLVQGGYGFMDGRLVALTQESLSIELRHTYENELVTLSNRLNFRRKMEVPSCSKWTRGGPASDRELLGLLNNMVPQISKEALEPLNFEYKAKEGLEEMDQVVEFARVNGTRSVKYLQYVPNSNMKSKQVMWGVTYESSRLVMMAHLKGTHGSKVGLRSVTARFSELADDRASPIYAALCHYGALLTGQSSRVNIVIGFRSCSSVREWWERFPEDVPFFCRLLYCFAAVLDRRQRRR